MGFSFGGGGGMYYKYQLNLSYGPTEQETGERSKLTILIQKRDKSRGSVEGASSSVLSLLPSSLAGFTFLHRCRGLKNSVPKHSTSN